SVGAGERLVHALLPAADGGLPVLQDLGDLRDGGAADPADGDFFLRGIEHEERGPRLDRVLRQEGGVARLLGVNGEPDELSGVPREGLVREDVGPHRAARVSPGRPGLDEDRKLFRARLRQGARIVVLDERDDRMGTRARGRGAGGAGGDRDPGRERHQGLLHGFILNANTPDCPTVLLNTKRIAFPPAGTAAAAAAPAPAPDRSSPFRTPQAIEIGANRRPGALAAADFNGDGKLDLAVGSDGSDDIVILLGDGRGSFRIGAPLPSGPSPPEIAAAAFDPHPKIDLAIANHSVPLVTVLLGDGKGRFRPAPPSPLTLTSNPH